MTFTGPSPHPVRKQDIEALLGIVAVVEGALLGGEVGEETTTKLARKLVAAELLSEDETGPHSTGHVALALDGIIGRLQWANGMLEVEPESRVETATAHIMRFPAKQAAKDCGTELLRGGASRVLVEHEQAEGWTLQAVYTEFAPDPGFVRRVRHLHEVAARFGGRYSGSQAPGD
jgi:hypothetical protein